MLIINRTIKVKCQILRCSLYKNPLDLSHKNKSIYERGTAGITLEYGIIIVSFMNAMHSHFFCYSLLNIKFNGSTVLVPTANKLL